MLRRKNNEALPTVLPLSPPGRQNSQGFLSNYQSNGQDGSGRSIKMDAPIVKSWKKASIFTKYSYYALGFFLLLLFIGYRYLRYRNASIWLTCHQHECTLEITPPGSRTKSVIFPRTQLDAAKAISTDKAGNFKSIDENFKTRTSNSGGKGRGRNKNNKNNGSYKGPDENGDYKSYALRFKKKTPEGVEMPEGMVDSDFYVVRDYLEDQGDFFELYMRKFNLSQSRTRIRSSMNKVDSYIKRRRQKIILKESATLPWQGILCCIFGLLGFMLTLLIGQFWDDEPSKFGGPGSRRKPTSSGKKIPQQSQFVINTGRPSKYPKGYQPRNQPQRGWAK